MSARHIALIVHDFPSGGSERIAIRLANAWAGQGRRVSIFCGSERGVARALVSPEVTVFACTRETRRTPWSRLLLGWRLARLVREHAPEVVFSPGNFHLIVLAVLARLRFLKRPAFVSKISNPIRRSGLRHWLKWPADWLISWAARPVDVLVAMSPALGAETREVFGSAKVVEIDEPVLEDAFVPQARPVATRDADTILCIGRLSHQKDFELAVRAFARVRGERAVRLRIVGEGPLRALLEAEAIRLGIAHRVDMPGHVPDIAAELSRADMLLMSSRYEGYPAVLVEAIAAGLPVVSTDCSLAIREIISRAEIGTVVTSRDPAELAKAVEVRLAAPRAEAGLSAQLTARHRIGPSSRAYLALFDRLVERACH